MASTYRFWCAGEALARYDELRDRVIAARGLLPAWMANEAVDHALSQEERADFFALETLMENHDYGRKL